jgi:hypothetical protein
MSCQHWKEMEIGKSIPWWGRCPKGLTRITKSVGRVGRLNMISGWRRRTHRTQKTPFAGSRHCRATSEDDNSQIQVAATSEDVNNQIPSRSSSKYLYKGGENLRKEWRKGSKALGTELLEGRYSCHKQQHRAIRVQGGTGRILAGCGAWLLSRTLGDCCH